MTLVEVLAVVVILGIIAATLTISFRGQVGKAKRELAKTGIGVVVAAIETYAIETGRLPTMEEGLEVLTRPTQGRSEPYLKADKLTDPWGNPYIYVTPSSAQAGGAYAVISYGADGQPGAADGDEEARDITSDDLAERGTGGR
jgi:general secretion pathway protein G